jgi:hypothetical protein
MVPFCLWNNDSLPTQFCIYRSIGGEPTKKWMRTQMAQHGMELGSTDGERPPLFLGRKKDRNKE